MYRKDENCLQFEILGFCDLLYLIKKVKRKVKQSRYSPGVAQRVPGS
jgi:hypothetical protein